MVVTTRPNHALGNLVINYETRRLKIHLQIDETSIVSAATRVSEPLGTETADNRSKPDLKFTAQQCLSFVILNTLVTK